jgi:hypothetical protein
MDGWMCETGPAPVISLRSVQISPFFRNRVLTGREAAKAHQREYEAKVEREAQSAYRYAREASVSPVRVEPLLTRASRDHAQEHGVGRRAAAPRDPGRAGVCGPARACVSGVRDTTG